MMGRVETCRYVRSGNAASCDWEEVGIVFFIVNWVGNYDDRKMGEVIMLIGMWVGQYGVWEMIGFLLVIGKWLGSFL